jgi:aminoglycoside phosphotransferase (APT) family kinase protein
MGSADLNLRLARRKRDSYCGSDGYECLSATRPWSVLSAFVADRSFTAFFRDSRTHERALAMLGRTIRRVQELSPPSDTRVADPGTALEAIWRGSMNGIRVPPFVRDAVQSVLAEPVPQRDRPLVLSHSDVNPSNLAYDGEHLLFLDWDVAAINDPWYDLATTALFFRMDDATCSSLIAAYEGVPVAEVPPAFRYFRRLVGALCGSTGLQMAHARGHTAGDNDQALTLGAFYEQMRSGAVNLATPEGQWKFGLALLGTV